MNLNAFTAQTTARQTAAALDRDNAILRSIAARTAPTAKTAKRGGLFSSVFAVRAVRMAH